MIGGRIFDDTVLVGFALGRSVYVLAAGKLACPGCTAPLRCAAGYVPPHGGPSRCGPRPPSARDPMLGAIPPLHTPAGRRRRGDGATPRRARSAVCRVAARLAAGSPQGCSWYPSQRVFNSAYWAGLRPAAGDNVRTNPRHHAHHGADMHTNDPYSMQ